MKKILLALALFLSLNSFSHARTTNAIWSHAEKRIEREGELLMSLPDYDVHSLDVKKQGDMLICNSYTAEHFFPPSYGQSIPANGKQIVRLSFLHKIGDPDQDIVPTRLFTKSNNGSGPKFRMTTDEYAEQVGMEVLDAIHAACPDVNFFMVNNFFADLFIYNGSIDFRSRPWFIPDHENPIIRTDFSLEEGVWRASRELPWSVKRIDEHLNKGNWTSRKKLQYAVWDQNQDKYPRKKAKIVQRAGPPVAEEITSAYIREMSDFGFHKGRWNELIPNQGPGHATVDEVQVTHCAKEGEGYRCQYIMKMTIHMAALASILKDIVKVPDKRTKTQDESHLFVSTSQGWRSPSLHEDRKLKELERNRRMNENVKRSVEEANQKAMEDVLDLLL